MFVVSGWLLPLHMKSLIAYWHFSSVRGTDGRDWGKAQPDGCRCNQHVHSTAYEHNVPPFCSTRDHNANYIWMGRSTAKVVRRQRGASEPKDRNVYFIYLVIPFAHGESYVHRVTS
jgi:hypothetical protein